MFKRSSYLVIILLLLIQLISCLPRSSSTDAVDSILPRTTTITPSVGENAVQSGLNSFKEVVRKNLINCVNFELQRTNQIAEDVLADPSMYSIDSEAMQKELSVLRKYVTDSKEVLNKSLLAHQFRPNTFVSFSYDVRNIGLRFERFHWSHGSKFEPLTPEEQVTWDALKKHGFLEYDEEMRKRVDEYQSNMVDKFEKYVKTLSAAEKEKDKDMKDMMAAWNAYTKNETSKTRFVQRLLEINLRP
ncbi:uncharacterized protein LOC105232386 isoform X2 [Bactrocera dorsalis]|uniref:Uncharacterized protein LOC105232386 isoform X2 n=1 Tax=Bactrocera dorsalis TaxID=27457 RepID=A0ABM3J0J8_BACDO|nr:uncharacterized protein LOC105232386 isoform X2 [Bactrocera dorsalis]